MTAIPLSQATLCASCNCVTASRGNCAACGSSALLNLARVLDRAQPVNEEVAILERMMKCK